MNFHLKKLGTTFLLALVVVSLPVRAEQGIITVQAKAGVDDQWVEYPTRTLAALPAGIIKAADSDLNQYGGLISRREKATGYFHAARIGERWWLVDPDGCLFLYKGVDAVAKVPGTGPRLALKKKFGNESNWVAGTSHLLHENGFNSLGAWSETDSFRQSAHPVVYTRIWNFMSSYGDKRGGTYQQSGHMGYPNDCIFVFDPEFEAFCDDYARKLSGSKNDPWLLGHFSDNELPFRRDALKRYLQLPEQDPGHKAALAWLHARLGEQAAIQNISEKDERDFLEYVSERYHRIVSRAIKKYDPNHIFLGSRFHGMALSCPEIFRAAGPYLDVVAVNYYRSWTPAKEKLTMWEREAGKPILVTEWYAKAMDAGLANTGGAGWVVKTQRDRGLFYQNFTLGLLESRVCVGWDWFKYADNDPANTQTDPSNRDANKGIVTSRYELYQTLLDAMKPVNERVYSLADFFDKAVTQPSRRISTAATPEAEEKINPANSPPNAH